MQERLSVVDPGCEAKRLRAFSARVSVATTLGLALLTSSPLWAAPQWVSNQPAQNAKAVVSSANVSITYSENMDASSVQSSTFPIYSSLRGQLPGTYNVQAGDTPIFAPDTTFMVGEKISVSATTGMLGLVSGVGSLSPYLWQFRVRVAGGKDFFDSTQGLGSGNSNGVALGDVDGDGDIDAVIANVGSANSVWVNNGSGVFVADTQSFAVDDSYDVALGDVDGDGDLDALFANSGISPANLVFINDGNGVFTDSSQALGARQSRAVELVDLDGDGDLDAFFANSDVTLTSPNTVYFNDGNGTFVDSGQRLGTCMINPCTGASICAGGEDYDLSYGLAAGDIDGDFLIDIVVADQGKTATVWKNLGGGFFGFEQAPSCPASVSYSALGSTWGYDVDLADLDGDGDLDLFVGNISTPKSNSVWLNSGGGFSDSGQSLGSSDSYGVRLGDIDGDGDIDAFVANSDVSGASNTVWVNAGNGNFGSSPLQSLGSGVSRGADLADVDGDGDLDVFVANAGGSFAANTVWYNNTPPSIATNTGATLNEGEVHTLVPTELAATDVDDSDAALVYTLTRVPVNGQLELLGSGLGVSATFTQGDIDSGSLVYRHDGSETTSDDFQFTVADAKLASTSTQTFLLAVTPQNDTPQVVTNNGATVLEGGQVDLGASNLRSTDADNLDSTLIYRLTVLPSQGQIRSFNTALALGDTFTQADLDAGNKINYLHAGGEVDNDSFAFTVEDPGGAVTTQQTFAIAVTPVNDPPTVTFTGIASMNEGATQTITQALLEATDVDNLNPAELTFTILDAPTNGTLHNGVLLVGTNGTFTQADINAGNVTYTHDGSETTLDTFRFVVRDPSNAEAPAETFSITIVPVNDLPVIEVNAGLSVSEGGQATIGNGALRTTDVDNSADQIVYTLTQIPSKGSLLLGATVLGVGDTFTQVNIDANNLSYQHDGSQTTTDSFAFTVSDGIDTLPETVFAISIGAVNNPPVVQTNTGATLDEGATQALTQNQIYADDPDNTPGELTYRITATPQNGTLRKGVTALGVNGTFTLADLDVANPTLSYEHDGSETTADSFQFVVVDPAGASSANTTFLFTVTPVNDLPQVLSNLGLALPEGATAVISNTALRSTDAETSDPAQLTYSVTQDALYGELLLDGSTAIQLGGTFTQADVGNGRISYRHDGSETSFDDFRFTVSDGSDSSPEDTFAISISPVNDAPVVQTNGGLTVAEGASATIDGTRLNSTDTDDTDSSLVYVLTRAPVNGDLYLGTQVISGGGSFGQSDVNALRVSYQHNGSETLSDNFEFVVRDAAGASAPAQEFLIAVTAIDDPPVIDRNLGIILDEGATTAVGSGVLRALDSDTSATSLLFTLTQAPANGSLLLVGAPIAVAATFTQYDVDNSLLRYQHDGSETSFDSFRYTLADATTTLSERIFAVTVNPVNDTPVVAINSGLGVTEGASASITNTNLLVTDDDLSDTPAVLRYRVLLAPANGTLWLSSQALGAGSFFYQADIDAGYLSYQHDGSQTSSDTIRFEVSDGVTAPPAFNFDIIIAASNNAPVMVNNLGGTVDEGGSLIVTGAMLSASDVDNADDQLVFRLTVAPVNGTLYDNVVALGVGDGFQQSHITSGRIRYVHDGGETTLDQFSFRIEDPFGASTSVDDFLISVSPVNDLPQLSVNTGLTLDEGATVTLASSALSSSDVEQGPTEVRYQITGLPSFGSLRIGATPLGAGGTFTQNDIDLGTISYRSDGSETISDSFRFVVSDGIDTTIESVFVLTITPVNDPPFVARKIDAYVTEDQSVTIDNGILRASDDDNVDAGLLFTLTRVPVHGDLMLRGSALAQGDTFVQADIDGLELSYRHDGSELSSDDLAFTVTDPVGAATGAQVLRIIVRPVNDAPILATNLGATVTARSQVIIGNNLLAVTDADDTDAALIYTITQVPSHGRLRNGISNVPINGRLTQGDIDSNKLVYIHNGDEATADSFAFRVRDPRGAELAETSFVITITAINDAPTIITAAGLVLGEGQSSAITTAMLSATDPDDDDATLVFRLSSAPRHGSVLLSGSLVGLNGTFTQGDIDASRLSYQHDGSELSSDLFRVVVSDALGATSDEATFDITINPTNDTPTVVNNGLSINEGDSAIITSTQLSAQDVDSNVAALLYTLVTQPSHGSLAVNQVRLQAGNTFTQGTINAGSLHYQHDGGEDPSDSFVFTVRDPENAQTGDITFAITVLPVNDPPVVAGIPDQSVVLGEAFAVISLDDYVTDPDNDVADMTWSSSASSNLNITIDSSRVASVQIASADWVGSETVTFVADDGSDTGSQDVVFEVTAAPNASPVFVDPTPSGNLEVYVGELLSFTAVANDPDGDSLTYGGDNLPIGARVDPDTGVFTWTPLAQHVGSWPITLTAKDLTHTATRDLTIVVQVAPKVDAGVVDSGAEDPNASGGCQCRSGTPQAGGALGLLLMLGLVLRRRRSY